jgi:biopolymer transport protein ExbD
VSNARRALINPLRGKTLSANESHNEPPKKRISNVLPNINVTPLIDVLLVLLIIFMVIAPRREAQFPVKVPAPAPEDAPPAPETLMLTMSDDFQLALNTKPIGTSELALVLTDLMEQREADMRTLYIKAPPLVPYDSVVSLIDTAKGAGVVTVGLLADS